MPSWTKIMLQLGARYLFSMWKNSQNTWVSHCFPKYYCVLVVSSKFLWPPPNRAVTCANLYKFYAQFIPFFSVLGPWPGSSVYFAHYVKGLYSIVFYVMISGLFMRVLTLYCFSNVTAPLCYNVSMQRVCQNHNSGLVFSSCPWQVPKRFEEIYEIRREQF